MAAVVTAVAVLFHLGFLYALIRECTGFSFPRIAGSYSHRKAVMVPFMIIWFVISYLYFKSRSSRIIEKYGDQKFGTFRNIAFVIVIAVLPLLVAILLSRKVE